MKFILSIMNFFSDRIYEEGGEGAHRLGVLTSSISQVRLRSFPQNNFEGVLYHHLLACLRGSILVGYRYLTCLAGVRLEPATLSLLWRAFRRLLSFLLKCTKDGVSDLTLLDAY